MPHLRYAFLPPSSPETTPWWASMRRFHQEVHTQLLGFTCGLWWPDCKRDAQDPDRHCDHDRRDPNRSHRRPRSTRHTSSRRPFRLQPVLGTARAMHYALGRNHVPCWCRRFSNAGAGRIHTYRWDLWSVIGLGRVGRRRRCMAY
jgi:hypothetical protein